MKANYRPGRFAKEIMAYMPRTMHVGTEYPYLQVTYKITQSNSSQAFSWIHSHWPRKVNTYFGGGLWEKSNRLNTSRTSLWSLYFILQEKYQFNCSIIYLSLFQYKSNVLHFLAEWYNSSTGDARTYSSLSFNNEKTHIQREKVTCSRPHSKSLANMELETGLPIASFTLFFDQMQPFHLT